MSLARITERIQEEKEKKGKIDGRRFNSRSQRFNSRSQKKMMWQVKDLQKGLKKKKKNPSRGGYSKEELEEYRLLNIKAREEGEVRIIVKNTVNELIDEVIDKLLDNI